MFWIASVDHWVRTCAKKNCRYFFLGGGGVNYCGTIHEGRTLSAAREGTKHGGAIPGIFTGIPLAWLWHYFTYSLLYSDPQMVVCTVTASARGSGHAILRPAWKRVASSGFHNVPVWTKSWSESMVLPVESNGFLYTEVSGYEIAKLTAQEMSGFPIRRDHDAVFDFRSEAHQSEANRVNSDCPIKLHWPKCSCVSTKTKLWKLLLQPAFCLSSLIVKWPVRIFHF